MSFEEYCELTTMVILVCPKCKSDNTTSYNFVGHPSCFKCGFVDWSDWDNQSFKFKRISII